MMAVLTDNKEAEIPIVTNFVSVQLTDEDILAVFASIEKSSTSLRAENDGVFGRVSSSEGASIKVASASLRLVSFVFATTYCSLAGMANVACTNP